MRQARQPDYEERLAAQNGVCAICLRPPVGRRRLANDHCHRSGVERGLLCERCNVGIGHLGDDPMTLRRAADYIERYHVEMVPVVVTSECPERLAPAIALAEKMAMLNKDRDRLPHAPSRQEAMAAMLGRTT